MIQYRVRLNCTSVQSDQSLSSILLSSQIEILDIIKINNRQTVPENRWTDPFQKFSRLRVKRMKFVNSISEKYNLRFKALIMFIFVMKGYILNFFIYRN